MKLRIASDFHLEFYQYKSITDRDGKHINENIILPVLEDEDQQTLLIAGDVVMATTCHLYEPFFDSLSRRFKDVLVIMGNHEHYKSVYQETFQILHEFYHKWENIHLLQNRVYFPADNPNTGIFCGTFWTNFYGANPIYMTYAQQSMADFTVIAHGDSDSSVQPVTRFTPEQSVIEHQKSKQSLEEFLKLDLDKRIVMTHHAPSFLSTAEKFHGSKLNPAFASSLDQFVYDSGIDLWVHGHMHNNSDYKIGKTRIVCNPYGYHKENSDYIFDFVVDI